ncbi:MAG: DUF4340 domain-containing protein [Rhodanobacteraceae bacterium]
MNRRTLIGLALAAVAVFVVAIVIGRFNAPRTDVAGGQAETSLVPSLRDRVNDIDRVVVTGAGGKPVATMTRNASGWSIAEKNGFAVDTGKLREFLLKLADAKLVEQKTSNKDKYATLGVEDVAAADAKGVEVELGGLKEPVKIIVGNANARGGTFVRRAGETASWLASGSISVDKKVENWLRKDLADVTANRVASVTITRPDGKVVRVAKDSEGDTSFRLADVPKGREPAAEFTINGVAGTLAGLRFEDVVSAKDAAPPEKPLNARFATFDGLVVDVVAWEKDGKDYAQIAASQDRERASSYAAAAPAKPKPDSDDAARTADAKSDASKSADEKIAAVDREAADLNQRAKGWTFVLPAYKYATLNKSTDDLLKPLDDRKPDAKAGAKKPAPVKQGGS